MKNKTILTETYKIVTRFESLRTWSRNGIRAPHKPLVILCALGRLVNDYPRLCSYEEMEPKLKQLLKDFAPYRNVINPHYPFCRLANDEGNIWELSGHEKARHRARNRETDDYLVTDLKKYHVMAGFPEPVFNQLKADPLLVSDIATMLLTRNFPESIHADILQCVELTLQQVNSYSSAKRSAHFRDRVLRAYEYKCAICDFDVRISNTTVGLEAAHIKWHQANGPDIESNGMAMCVLHHKLFDSGVFTIDNHFVLHVSEMASGSTGFEEWLMRFHGKPIRHPIRSSYAPQQEYIKWHVKEVFKGYPRELI